MMGFTTGISKVLGSKAPSLNSRFTESWRSWGKGAYGASNSSSFFCREDIEAFSAEQQVIGPESCVMSGGIWLRNQDIWRWAHYFSDDIMVWLCQLHLLTFSLLLVKLTALPGLCLVSLSSLGKGNQPFPLGDHAQGHMDLCTDHELVCQNFLTLNLFHFRVFIVFTCLATSGLSSCTWFL